MSRRYPGVDIHLYNLIETSLNSHAIQWDINLQIVDRVRSQEGSLCYVLDLVEVACGSTSTAKVELALTLLEMAVKNIGYGVVALFSEELVAALVDLIKKPKTLKGRLSRMQAVVRNSTDLNTERDKDIVISQKVLALFQTWADTFLMQQGECRYFFVAYRKLRQKGYQFPTTDADARYQIRGADQSPALNPNLASGQHSTPSAARPLDETEIEVVKIQVLEAKRMVSEGESSDDLKFVTKELQGARGKLAAVIQKLTEEEANDKNSALLVEYLQLNEEV